MVEVGDRRHRFVVQSRTLTTVGQDRLPLWETVGYRWGTLVPSGSSEPTVSEQISPRRTFKIEILTFPGLTSAHRLKKGNRILRIVGPPVDPDEEGVYQVLNVVELEFDDLTAQEAEA